MTAPRQATVEIAWQTKEAGADGLLTFEGEPRDISRDIAPYLRGLSYTDNLTSAADDLSIELHDREGLWSGDWRPVFGDVVVARLQAEPWLTRVTDLRLGKFAHDKISLSGPPKVATIKAVSAPLATGLRRHKRNRKWSGLTLFEIAKDIADRAEMTLQFEGDDGLKYGRREQRDKSDLDFLDEACQEVGRNLKVTEDAIVIFDEETRDSTASVGSIALAEGHVLSWAFDADDSGRYGSCHLKFFNPRTGKVTEGEFPKVGTTPAGFAALGLDPDGQTLEVRMPASDRPHAEAICKGKLRNANRFATSGRLTVVGDPGLVAGVTFDLTDAFGFDGKFIITKAEHRPVGGYVCTLDVRRCVVGY